MQDKLQILHHNNEVKYKYILFDKWFSSIKNLLFIEEELNKKFVCPIKSNRKIALILEERNKGKYVNKLLAKLIFQQPQIHGQN